MNHDHCPLIQRILVAAIVVIVLAIPFLAGADRSAQPVVPVAETENPPTAIAERTPWWLAKSDDGLSPLLRDIKAAWLKHSADLAGLEARRDAAVDEFEHLEIQRAIEAHHLLLERTFLTIQIDHARRDGRAEDLQKLEAALRRHDAPPDLRAEGERRPRDARLR
jgi:hypothetical protein